MPAERRWEPFHDPKNLSASIAIEAAELMEHFQWLRSDQLQTIQDDQAAMREIVEVPREQDSQTRLVSSVILEVRENIETSVTATMQTRSTADRLRTQAEQLEHLIEHFDRSDRPRSDA